MQGAGEVGGEGEEGCCAKRTREDVGMKRLKYECYDCEDIEFWDEILKEGFHCECGGHLFLVKTDNFKKVDNYSDCMVCSRKDTDDCIDCKRNGKTAD